MPRGLVTVRDGEGQWQQNGGLGEHQKASKSWVGLAGTTWFSVLFSALIAKCLRDQNVPLHLWLPQALRLSSTGTHVVTPRPSSYLEGHSLPAGKIPD